VDADCFNAQPGSMRNPLIRLPTGYQRRDFSLPSAQLGASHRHA
jgi:hypothetical protein